MHRAMTLIGGIGLGAGLMYLLDPQMGRRRRALVRDQVIHLEHEAEGAARVVGRDLSNRTQGLLAEARAGLRFDGRHRGGNRSAQPGGQAPRVRQLDLFQRHWSPATRFLVGAVGFTLFGYGLTLRAPQACVVGTMGLGMLAQGLTDASLRQWIEPSASGTRRTESRGNTGQEPTRRRSFETARAGGRRGF